MARKGKNTSASLSIEATVHKKDKSLSPHRILSTDEERPQSERAPEKDLGPGQFETMILDNLTRAGVQNTFRNERLKFGGKGQQVGDSPAQICVEIRGLDVYDPTTGQIRSHSTDDIACWFIDTDYNEESFFVRHAYFSGGDEPYEKLKRALRAEVDESAWSSLYSTVSRPFLVPKTGKIAIKVIYHYGDEVLKGYNVKD